MRLLFAVLLAGLVSTSGPANAISDQKIGQFLSAAYILDACKEAPKSGPGERGRCEGQIEMLYILALLGPRYLGEASRFCPPDGASVDQVKRVVIKYIEERPERLHEPFFVLALESLRKAWPCR